MIGAIMDAGTAFPKAPVDFVVIRFSDEKVRHTAVEARARGLRYVLWPKNIYLSETRPEVRSKYFFILNCVKPDLGWIFDLETNPDGNPLSGMFFDAFLDGLLSFRHFSLTGEFMGLPRAAHISEDPYAEHVFVSRRVNGKDYPLAPTTEEMNAVRRVRGHIILAGSPRADYYLLKQYKVI